MFERHHAIKRDLCESCSHKPQEFDAEYFYTSRARLRGMRVIVALIMVVGSCRAASVDTCSALSDAQGALRELASDVYPAWRSLDEEQRAAMAQSAAATVYGLQEAEVFAAC